MKVVGFDVNVAAAGHGVARAGGQSEKNLLQLQRVNSYVPELLAKAEMKPEVFSSHLAQQFNHLCKQEIDVDHPRIRRLQILKIE